MPGRTQIIFAGLAICIVAALAGAEDDVGIRAEELYARGEYLQVIDLLEPALSDSSLETPVRIRFLRLLGSSYVAVGNVESAKSRFKAMLSLDPEIELDPLSTSPKIVSVFQEAKAEFEADNTPVAPDTLAPDLAPFEHRAGVWVGPALKSLVLPGLGQLANGDHAKGIIFMSAEALSLAGLVVSQMWYEDARREYGENTDPDRMAALYNEYNRWYMMRNGFIATSAGICLLSSVEAIIGAYEGEFERRDRGLGFAPLPGGVEITYRF